MIVTISEFTRNTLNGLMSSAAAEDIARAVQPIYFAKDDGRAHHLGSCVLVKYKSRHLLLTAAHVIDANKVSSLYIPVRGRLERKLEGAGLATVAPSGIRDRDKFDFSIIELPPHLVNALGPIRYVQENELQSDVIAGRPYMAFGYPNSQNKKIDHQIRKVVSKRFAYGGALFVPDQATNNGSTALGDHLLRIKYERHSRTRDGDIVNSIDPRGISGGAIFDLGRMIAVSPDWTDPPKLAGILFERRRQERTIVATNISTILGSLEPDKSF
ncbi:trypsin-like peptidase domain-containing protein [Bradyrhizobium sp. WSM3983]|uniref:trypsin-like peptidase domain-containing protein n=1 Tax=Bradyrhizobium sp. WSM3983 TaxID=1038867 RepID=UPI000484AE52|nr:trypsin-like peptidase domain-containing protein [Bradyrhizobium sp. WSM3983]